MADYVAIMRCNTWNMWPARTVIPPCAIEVLVPESPPLPAQLAIMSYEDRSQPARYTREPTTLGPLIWDGTVPGLYLVRDTVLKAPEETIEVAIPLRQAHRGEVDICISFRSESAPPPRAIEAVRATLYAALSAINLRLGDYLTPAAPPHIKMVSATSAKGETNVLSLCVPVAR